MTQTILLLLALGVASLCAAALYFEKVLLKFAAITAIVVMASAVYFSLDGVKGWPAEEPTKVKGILASVVIVNPTKRTPGAIYISLFPTLPKKWYEYEYPRKAPKTYYVEYSNDRAAKFELAKEAMEEGRQVRINGIPAKDGKGSGDEQTESNTEGFGDTISRKVREFLSNERDTYNPEVPEVEIEDSDSMPPKKETNNE